jgi:hypothetical protein
MGKHHDTGYKELFSHPEFIEQLIEGFAPPEIAAMMDFATLKNHSGHSTSPRCLRRNSRTSCGRSRCTGGGGARGSFSMC